MAIDGRDHEVTINVNDAGSLTSNVLTRRAKPNRGPFQLHTFGVTFKDEFTTAGYTLPGRGGGPVPHDGKKASLYGATIDQARFF